MAVLLAEPVRAKPRPWPRHWVDQEPLLERQHDGLEAYLAELLWLHGSKDSRPAFTKDKYGTNDRAFNFNPGDLRGMDTVLIPEAPAT